MTNPDSKPNLSDVGYGSTAISSTAALPLGEEVIDLGQFKVGSNFTLGEDFNPDLQLSPSNILDKTPLFWSGKPNAFWFKTHDDREFQKTVETQDVTNSVTLDTVVVSPKQSALFTKAMQTNASKLKDYIVGDLAPFYLSYKNAIWVAQQELQQLTGDTELDITDLGSSYNTFLRKALRYKLASYACTELEIPNSFLQDLIGREQAPSQEHVLRNMLQQIVQDIGGMDVKPTSKAKT
jgi:hypothetical protein